MTPPNLPLRSRRAPASVRRNASRRGAALVITLGILVLVVIMVVGFTETSRIERSAASLHLERASAELMAQMGVDRVLAKLHRDAGSASASWISQPGQLVVSDPANAAAPLALARAVPLSSGRPSAALQDPAYSPAYLRPPNLNIHSFEDAGTRLITETGAGGQAPAMLVKWIYVRQDGTLDFSEAPDIANRANPIVGRYAYWADDESAKVNCNLAWTRGSANPNPPSHPSQVSLAALLGSEAMAAAIHFYKASASHPATAEDYRSIARFFFQTPEDARQVSGAEAFYDALTQARFSLTHYNHTPERNCFGEPRIALTTKDPDPAANNQFPGSFPYLKVLVNEGSDPGDYGNLSAAHLNDTLFGMDGTVDAPKAPGLLYYLTRSDWPILPGRSLKDKYAATYPTNRRLLQIAVNIIDYVRSKESEYDIVEPIRGYLNPSGKLVLANPGNSDLVGWSNMIMGVARGPMITEMALHFPDGTGNRPKAKIEIHLPDRYGLPSVDLGAMSRYICTVIGGSSYDEKMITGPEVTSGSLNLLAGDYTVITVHLTTPPSAPTGTGTLPLRVALAKSVGGKRTDLAPLVDNLPGAAVKYNVNEYSVGNASPIMSFQVDDPRVNQNAQAWKLMPDTFGRDNAGSALEGAAALDGSIRPKQDARADGATISTAGLYMPPPKGKSIDYGSWTDDNRTGKVISVGELGYVSTGVESIANGGAPWRTVSLRPGAGAHELPDWVLLDLFTVPSGAPVLANGDLDPHAGAVYAPHGTAAGGRVNINAAPEPFALDRTAPLAAVLEGARYDSGDLSKTLNSAQAQTIAASIYNRSLSQGVFAGQEYGYPHGYDMPAEVVEIAGIADGGEASEQLVRDIADLITARGGVFTVYTVGQALKQTPDGRLLLQAERRQQAMVERYEEAVAGTAERDVRFRPIYCRNLAP